MQQQLINHNPDLKRLVDEGYDIEIRGGQYLVVHHIPYVNVQRQVRLGSLVCLLTLASPTRITRPNDHTAYFQGEIPCDAEGVPLSGIINNSQTQHLSSDLIVNHYFSSKPSAGNYPDQYEKVRTYSQILCSEAQQVDSRATYKPKRNQIEKHEGASI